MKNKKLFVNIIFIIIMLLIPIILYGFNFNLIAFDQEFYRKEFSKYNVYSDLRDYDVDDINNKVLNYLRFDNGNRLIDIYFFNEREKQHLLDVKNLVQKILLIHHLSIILSLLSIMVLFLLMNFDFRIVFRKLLIILIIGSLLTLLDAISFFLLSGFNFNFVFNLLHKTFFSLGTYLFNPDFENIVVLYPENLFFDLLIKIISYTIFSSIILIFVSLILFLIFFKKNFSKIFQKFTSRKTKNKRFKYYFYNKLKLNFRNN